MANFVLVHGAWRGGWIWKRVAQRLRKEGHDVYAPTLSGLAERRHLLQSGINLSSHIEEIAGLIEFEDLRDVILCGHSYAGMVVTGVADRLSEKICSLVYLDAWFPQDGDALTDLHPPYMNAGMLRSVAQHGGIASAAISSEVLCVNERDRAMVDKKVTLHPLATVTEAIRLQGNHLKVKTKMYVLATGWEPSPFKKFYDQLSLDPTWTMHTIEAGHDVMLNDLDGVIGLLQEAAGL